MTWVLIAEGSHWEWTLTRADEPWQVAAAVCAALAGMSLTWWMSRREKSSGKTLERWATVVLRSAAWILLALVTLGPARVHVAQQEILPQVAVLRDVSPSIDSSLMREVERHLGLSVNGKTQFVFERRTQTVVHDFAAGLSRNGDANTTPSVPSDPVVARRSEHGTDIALALREAADAGQPAAIVLLSDGRVTTGDDPRAVARELGERGLPIFAVGVGEAAYDGAARVIAVESRSQVWKGEPFVVEVTLESTSVEPRNVTLQLVRTSVDGGTDDGGAELEVGHVPLTIDRSQGRVRREFRVQEDRPGKIAYRAQIAAERTADSERTKFLSRPVTVLERDRLRVLVIAGEPTWDFRQVERWLGREPTLESTCWLQSADEGRRCTGTRPLDEPPASLDEVLWYDVILLLDPDPERFVGDWATWLRQFVELHKGGVLYQSGPRFSGAWRAGTLGETLAELWPVESATAGELEAAQTLAPPTRGWPVRVPTAERGHLLLREAGFVDAATPSESWKVFWSSPVAGRRTLARVLLEDSNPETMTARGPRPLLAVGRSGAAHVAYLGCTGVWRGGGDLADGEAVERWREAFWLRLTRYLAEGRVWEGHRRGWLEVDRPRVEVGERVEIVARLQELGDTGANELAATESLSAVIRPEISTGKQNATSDDVAKITLAKGWDGLHEFRGVWTATRSGAFAIEVPLSDSRGLVVETLVAPLEVEMVRAETREPGLDDELLREVARLSGGRYFTAAEAGRVLAELPLQREVRVTRSPPKSAWDNVGTLVALAGLLGGEWWLRKRNRKR